jgi:hypothetical protein
MGSFATFFGLAKCHMQPYDDTILRHRFQRLSILQCRSAFAEMCPIASRRLASRCPMFRSRTGNVIRPVAGHEHASLPLQLSTLAELLHSAGHFVEVLPEATARDHEVRLESTFLDFQLTKYDLEREPGDSPWSFVVSEGQDAEQVSAPNIRLARETCPTLGQESLASLLVLCLRCFWHLWSPRP